MSLSEIARGWRWGRPALESGKPARPPSEFPTDWARAPRATLARDVLQETLLIPTLRFFATPTVRGRDRLRGLQPAILAPNHLSHMDTSLLIATLPPPWRHKLAVAAAADYFFRSNLGGRLAALGLNAFPIERNKASSAGAKLSIRLLNEGHNLLLFPEGGRSPDGWLQDLKPGAAFVSVKSGRPIVPVWISGTEHLFPKGAKLPRRGRVEVIFGDALWARDGESARELHTRLETAIHRLSVEATSDWWTAAKASATDAYGPDAGSWRRSWARGHAPRKQRSTWT